MPIWNWWVEIFLRCASLSREYSNPERQPGEPLLWQRVLDADRKQGKANARITFALIFVYLERAPDGSARRALVSRAVWDRISSASATVPTVPFSLKDLDRSKPTMGRRIRSILTLLIAVGVLAIPPHLAPPAAGPPVSGEPGPLQSVARLAYRTDHHRVPPVWRSPSLLTGARVRHAEAPSALANT